MITYVTITTSAQHSQQGALSIWFTLLSLHVLTIAMLFLWSTFQNFYTSYIRPVKQNIAFKMLLLVYKGLHKLTWLLLTYLNYFQHILNVKLFLYILFSSSSDALSFYGILNF